MRDINMTLSMNQMLGVTEHGRRVKFVPMEAFTCCGCAFFDRDEDGCPLLHPTCLKSLRKDRRLGTWKEDA